MELISFKEMEKGSRKDAKQRRKSWPCERRYEDIEMGLVQNDSEAGGSAVVSAFHLQGKIYRTSG